MNKHAGISVQNITTVRSQTDSPTYYYYYFGCIVDFEVLLFYLVCVDRSGSLSGGAFNQLKLVTLNIV